MLCLTEAVPSINQQYGGHGKFSTRTRSERASLRSWVGSLPIYTLLMRCLILVVVSAIGALPASAGLLYSFSYTAQTGAVQSFSFSLVSPTFIGPGTPALQPFMITDGSAVWTITQDLVGISTGVILGSTLLPAGDGCFSFGTSAADLSQSPGCGWFLSNNGISQAAFTVDVPGGLPSQKGQFSNLIFDGAVVVEPPFTEESFVGCCGESTGIIQLTVSDVSEPFSLGLVTAGICTLGVLLLDRSLPCIHRHA